jgi:hypothetical protein
MTRWSLLPAGFWQIACGTCADRAAGRQFRPGGPCAAAFHDFLRSIRMSPIAAAANLAIAGFYCVGTFWHMLRPGEDIGFTRMLMFAWLATIPLGFMLVMVGGRDRWHALAGYARELAAQGPAGLLVLACMCVLLVALPLGLLAAVWYGMGLKFGLLFLIYFTPLLVRMFTVSARESVLAGVTQGVLLFASCFAGMGIVWLLARAPGGAEVYHEHVQKIWPGYRDAATVFFSVCVFALINQVIEAKHALTALLGR